jgi:hypothetical protein
MDQRKRSKKTASRGLHRLGHEVINTSAVERSNLTARSMNAYQMRKRLAFTSRAEFRSSLAWWSLMVSNFVRVHRSLRVRLARWAGRRVYLERMVA